MSESKLGFGDGVFIGWMFAALIMGGIWLIADITKEQDFTDAAQRAIEVCPVAWEVYDLDWAAGELDLICEVE